MSILGKTLLIKIKLLWSLMQKLNPRQVIALKQRWQLKKGQVHFDRGIMYSCINFAFWFLVLNYKCIFLTNAFYIFKQNSGDTLACHHYPAHTYSSAVLHTMHAVNSEIDTESSTHNVG